MRTWTIAQCNKWFTCVGGGGRQQRNTVVVKYWTVQYYTVTRNGPFYLLMVFFITEQESIVSFYHCPLGNCPLKLSTTNFENAAQIKVLLKKCTGNTSKK